MKVSPDAGTEIMPGHRLMITMYYNRELMFSCQVISSKHIETFRSIIRKFHDFDIDYIIEFPGNRWLAELDIMHTTLAGLNTGLDRPLQPPFGR